MKFAHNKATLNLNYNNNEICIFIYIYINKNLRLVEYMYARAHALTNIYVARTSILIDWFF